MGALGPGAAAPNFAEMYERSLVEPLFRPWAETLLDRSRLRPGDRLLDIACGTGIVARLAAERLGSQAAVVGVDTNTQMLRVAQTVAPAIDWREGNASALPLAHGEQFDVIVCSQGLQFFPDKPLAVREMRRAAASGSRVAVAVWRSLDDAPVFRLLHGVAERLLGPLVDRRHAFGDPTALERLLAAGGFDHVEVERVAQTVRFDDAEPFLRLNAMALVGMSAAGPGMAEPERAEAAQTLTRESFAAVGEWMDGSGLVFELAANVATARTPAD